MMTAPRAQWVWMLLLTIHSRPQWTKKGEQWLKCPREKLRGAVAPIRRFTTGCTKRDGGKQRDLPKLQSHVFEDVPFEQDAAHLPARLRAFLTATPSRCGHFSLSIG
jgi:hypothetical protein